MKKICLCSWCINGIRSHGEKIYVGDPIDDYENNPECEWCNEDIDELFECVFEDQGE